ncbi:hypothetical protein Vi05172_g2756 [Venturia inaequalis]|nr:hypothetical protein Vi05172_g2756 [Venturia inaequalis]
MLINTKSILIALSAILTVTNAICFHTSTQCDSYCGPEKQCSHINSSYCC